MSAKTAPLLAACKASVAAMQWNVRPRFAFVFLCALSPVQAALAQQAMLQKPPVSSTTIPVDGLVLVQTDRLQFKPLATSDRADMTNAELPEGLDPFGTLEDLLFAARALPGDGRVKPCPPVAMAPYRQADGSLDDAHTLPLYLVQAVDFALCRNPQVRSAWAAIKVQAAALGESKAANFPTLSLSAGVVDDDSRSFSSAAG